MPLNGTNRRNFLKTSALTLAASSLPLEISSRGFAQYAAVADNEKTPKFQVAVPLWEKGRET